MVFIGFYSGPWPSASANSEFHNRGSPLAFIFGKKAYKSPRSSLAYILTLKKI